MTFSASVVAGTITGLLSKFWTQLCDNGIAQHQWALTSGSSISVLFFFASQGMRRRHHWQEKHPGNIVRNQCKAQRGNDQRYSMRWELGMRSKEASLHYTWHCLTEIWCQTLTDNLLFPFWDLVGKLPNSSSLHPTHRMCAWFPPYSHPVH